MRGVLQGAAPLDRQNSSPKSANTPASPKSTSPLAKTPSRKPALVISLFQADEEESAGYMANTFSKKEQDKVKNNMADMRREATNIQRQMDARSTFLSVTLEKLKRAENELERKTLLGKIQGSQQEQARLRVRLGRVKENLDSEKEEHRKTPKHMVPSLARLVSVEGVSCPSTPKGDSTSPLARRSSMERPPSLTTRRVSSEDEQSLRFP
mmetsp:Transcript_12482/g.29266  ORF Transcript_12482/g.29266 Transcript_12482/m.29266 type:complete len:210 (-) Transcript_12482:90-719(-)|eukprot:CAMPEP_0180192410 /NCGR_PEP_ID=MMETSP0987-20121128/1965_1 /TAXON_ID=697907 /ORGANISM="non described non described, Strain CCMP2293" /LENGTH=209 /DNA_ID=CAMNT_0022147035 /DNA_START=99 /DNA_END=728 /DNA_ORIENTATION=+